ncbi:MAG TPA: glycosyltransferase, partial [Myxococcaceae bacterium]|nr:glycosyltransferase [Myxococcaceae bacterium]
MKSERFKLVVFGLSVSSPWGNGHATHWRGLAHALAEQGHQLVFFERDAPRYAQHRDLTRLPGDGELVRYPDWNEAVRLAAPHLRDADAAMVTSYCPDGVAASDLVLASNVPVKAFYDLDTPVTLEALAAGERVDYLPPRGLGDFDLVLSFTGGPWLKALEERLGAKRAVALYGSVDPGAHHPVPPREAFAADLSYLGSYAANRQRAFSQLFLEPARRMPHKTFIIGGSMYPADFPWSENLKYVPHVAPPDHPAFYCSSRLTLNVTRGSFAALGYCPSARLFEAAACGIPVLSDAWPGLDTFFTPGEEL